MSSIESLSTIDASISGENYGKIHQKLLTRSLKDTEGNPYKLSIEFWTGYDDTLAQKRGKAHKVPLVRTGEMLVAIKDNLALVIATDISARIYRYLVLHDAFDRDHAQSIAQMYMSVFEGINDPSKKTDSEKKEYVINRLSGYKNNLYLNHVLLQKYESKRFSRDGGNVIPYYYIDESYASPIHFPKKAAFQL